uniref:Uncharacterized protein n=1 Tax=Erpetoichthys calabaricus TaxID=27687 RepID=A0A8C4SLW3_ERPCA
HHNTQLNTSALFIQINQSIFHSFNQSFNQSINQSITSILYLPLSLWSVLQRLTSFSSIAARVFTPGDPAKHTEDDNSFLGCGLQ